MILDKVFEDNYFKNDTLGNALTGQYTLPTVNKPEIVDVLNRLKNESKSFFANHNPKETWEMSCKTDEFFANLEDVEKQKLINKVSDLSGFSKYDIENFGLSIFPPLVEAQKDPHSDRFIMKALKEPKQIIKTKKGKLVLNKRPIFYKNPKDIHLISHFVSGNVVGYTSVLSKLGLPVEKFQGCGQIIKLPSTASYFPLLYMDVLNQKSPELRKTMACAYWKGGDEDIEKELIRNSSSFNVLGSDHTIKSIKSKIGKYNPKINLAAHGHKIGIGYIGKSFIDQKYLLMLALDGIVKDISAFDGGACYNTKNIYVECDQQTAQKIAEDLFERLSQHAKTQSPVSEENKQKSRALKQIYQGKFLTNNDCTVRYEEKPRFWLPDELARYVTIMPVENIDHVSKLLKKHRRYLQTAILADTDVNFNKNFTVLAKAGISIVHYPGSAPMLNVKEEPHDGVFDVLEIRGYHAEFTSSNYQTNKDWLSQERD